MDPWDHYPWEGAGREPAYQRPELFHASPQFDDRYEDPDQGPSLPRSRYRRRRRRRTDQQHYEGHRMANVNWEMKHISQLMSMMTTELGGLTEQIDNVWTNLGDPIDPWTHQAAHQCTQAISYPTLSEAYCEELPCQPASDQYELADTIDGVWTNLDPPGGYAGQQEVWQCAQENHYLMQEELHYEGVTGTNCGTCLIGPAPDAMTSLCHPPSAATGVVSCTPEGAHDQGGAYPGLTSTIWPAPRRG